LQLLIFVNLNTEGDWNGRMLDSYGKSGKAETPQEYATRRLSSRPMESEHSGVEINLHILK